ncbi:MAG: putative DNA binding domain-containing protein [Chitinispirillales bacterium]|jgi:predicted HTH transcriptional regulator|nr:putative DNA binding domain-containing protein [Chitinispirillales bacterium]
MEASELLKLIKNGESSSVQFKERINDAHKLSQELAAFSNTNGGIIVIGVNDKTGELNGLSFEEIRDTNRLLVDSSTNNVKPPVIVISQTVSVNDQSLIVVDVNQGISKPYKDKNGAIWIKNGSDKRRVLSNDEISRLLQSSKAMFADEMLVQGTSISDIDVDYFNKFLVKKYNKSLDELGINLTQSLENLNLVKDGSLTLAGLLFFSANRHKFRPLFSIQCISVGTTTLTGNIFTDNEPAFEGNMKDVFEKAVSFIERNLRKVPTGNTFNSQTVWEIPYAVFEELIVNALIHRDYFLNSTIKIFIFSDRIEIVSPGKLPNSLTIKNITSGISIPRNPILQTIAQHTLPYKGLGTGIMRAVSTYKEITFVNNQELEQFIVTIKRPVP